MESSGTEERPAGAGRGRDGVAAHRPKRVRRWRLIAIVVVAIVILPFGLIGIPAVSTPLVNMLARAFNPYPDTRVSIGRVSGGLLGGFELRDIRLTHGDGTPMLQVETLRATYRLAALLLRRVEIGRIDLVGADVRMRQQADSLWDWLAPFAAEAPAVEEPPDRAWRVNVRSLTIERSRLEAQTLDGTAGPLRVEDLDVRLADLRVDDPPTFYLDTLGARVFVPELPDTAAHVALAASFHDNVLRVPVLRLHSVASDVRGEGVLGLPGMSLDQLRDVDFRLRASPLDFRDIAPFVPALSSRPSLEIELRAGGAEELLTVTGSARLDDGAELTIDSDFWLTDGPVHWRLDADLRGLDFAHVLRDPIAAGPIDARVAFDLTGPGRDRLSGPAELRVSRLPIGDFTLLPAVITAVFDDGLARLDGDVGLASAGRTRLSGTMRPLDVPPAFDLRVDLSQAPGDRLEAPVAITDLDASLVLSWTGLDVDSLRAHARLDVNAVRLNEVAVEQGSAEVSWDVTQGEARIGATLADGTVAARAEVERHGQDWRLRLHEARASGLNLAALTGDTVPGVVEVVAQGVAEGADARSLRADFTADLAGTRYAALSIERSLIDASLRDGRLRASLDVRSDGGDVTAALIARPFEERPTYEASDIRLSALDLGRVGGPASRIHAQGSLRGAGAEPATMRLDGSIAVDSSWIGDGVIDGVRADYALAAGALRVTTEARALGGELTLAADARPFDVEPTFTIRLDPVRDIDLSAITGGRARTSLSGDVHVDGSGRSVASLRIDASARIAGAVNRGRMTLGEVRLRAADGRAELEANVETEGSGEVRVQGGATWSDAATVAVARVDPDNPRGRDALVPGSGAPSNSGDNAPERRDRLAPGERSAAPTSIRRSGNPRGRDALAPRRDAPGNSRDNHAAASSPPGGLDRGAGAEGAHSPGTGGPRLTEWSLDATARLPDLGDLAGLPEAWAAAVDATVEGGGSGLTRETFVLDLRSTISGELAELVIDSGRIAIAARDGAARIDTLRIDGNAFLAHGAGVVLYGPPRDGGPDRSDALLRIDLRDSAPLAGLVPVQALSARAAMLEARIEGQWPAQAFDATVSVADATVADIAIGALDVRAAGILAADSLGAVDADFRLTNVAAGHVFVDSAGIGTRYRPGERLPITLAMSVNGDRRLRAAASLDPADVAAGLVVEETELRLVRETWSLSEPARISWVDALVVDSLFLTSGERRLGAAGRIDPKGEQMFRVQIDSIGVGALSDLVGFPDLDGWISGRMRLDGPADMARLRGVFSGQLGDRDGSMAELRATVVSDSSALGVTARLLDENERRLEFSGSMPLHLSIDPDRRVDDPFGDGRFALTAQADSMSTGWMMPFLRPFGVTQLTGALVVDAGLGGTMDAPNLRGAGRFVGGSLVMPEFGVRYSDVSASAEMGGRGIRVSADARSGGSANVRGGIELDALRLGRLRLQGTFDRFHALTNDLTRFTMSGDVTIAGTTEAPRITGRVRVLDTDFFLDDAVEGVVAQVELTDLDMDMLRDYFGYVPTEAERADRDLLEPVELNLTVQLGESVWARRRMDPQMTLLLAGSLDVRKAAGDSIQLFGTLETVSERSYFRQFGRRFQVTQGGVTFNGYIPTWRVNMAAAYEVPDRHADATQVEITLAVKGGPEDLELTLDSNRALEAPDIISYLATGRAAASAMAFGEDGGFGETGAALAMGSAAGLLESLGADRIGLDVVEVRQDGARGATFVGGRFVSSRVYVGFQQPVILRQDLDGRTRQDGTRVEIEYAAYRWLLANVQGGAGTASVFLRARRAF